MGNRPFYNKKEKDLALKNMEKLSILDLKSKNFKDLSGGQKQRVLLSRALCASEKLLLLDEPVAGLDPKITQQLYSLVADLNKNYGLTIIMITHDLGESLKFCNKVLKIGDSYFFGTKEEYLAKAE
jgi:zinc transport system ATP-binding protein